MPTRLIDPVSMKDPIVDLRTGNITPYFQRILQDISEAKLNAALAEALGGDPDADMVVIWDDTAGEMAFLSISDILDWLGAGEHGEILFRGAAGWEVLSPGNNGEFLETNGTGFDPQWTNMGGVYEIPILCASMISRTTLGASLETNETTTNKNMYISMDFDPGSDEFAQWQMPMPKSWNESTITAKFIWTAASGSGDVIWGIQAVATSEGDPLDVAYGTAQTVTDTLTTAGDNHTTSYTSAVTIGGTPAEADMVSFQVYRDANNISDTLAVDAKLIAVVLQITFNARDDS